MAQNKTPNKLLPSCSQGIYNCKDCVKPLVPQSGKNDLGPCDGTIHFCRFATPSTATPQCAKYDLENFHCVHGGSNCKEYRRARRAY